MPVAWQHDQAQQNKAAQRVCRMVYTMSRLPYLGGNFDQPRSLGTGDDLRGADRARNAGCVTADAGGWQAIRSADLRQIGVVQGNTFSFYHFCD